MKPKIESEAATRNKILANAKRFGCMPEAKQIMNKYDKLLKGCTNEVERKQISIMGAAELHRLLNVKGPLVINGQEIIPGDPNAEDK